MRALAAAVVLWSAVAAANPRPALDTGPLAPPRGAPGPWPLSELPSVQPHLDLAMAHDACTPAAQQRQKDDEIRAYLTAWCRIRAGEPDAVDALAPLAKSKNIGLARSALLDIVNLVADHEPDQPAVTHLDRLGLASPHALDLLAATYLALGQRDDAFFVGRQAIRMDTHATSADICERELAWSSLDQLRVRPEDDVEARRAGSCQHRLLALDCALTKSRARTALGTRLIAMRECFVELPDDPDLDAKLAVIAAYRSWSGPTDTKHSLEVEVMLEPALSVKGAEELAVAGLEQVHSYTCDRVQLDTIAAAAKRMRGADRHDPVFDRRLADLAKPGQQCRN
jgi:hypothetical protein